MTLSKCYGSTSRRCQRSQFDVNLLITDRPIFLENGVQSSLLLKWIYYCWDLTQSWIGDSTPLIAYSRYWISVELGFWIPIVSGILDSLNCIPDFKAQDSGFHIPKFPEFWIPDSWKVGRLNQNRSKVALKAKFPTGLGVKNGWAVPGVCIEPVDEKLAWIPHVLELKKSFVKKLDVLKKSKFLPRSVRHFSLSDLWSYTVGFLLQLWLISVSGTASLQGCETYNFDLPKDTASFCKSYTKDNKNFLHNF